MDELVGQLGLIFTQLRHTRRAVEDIERSTARYAGFAFTSALSAGPRFGAPPLFDGALKVYVVNINDLAPGGGFFDSLIGAITRIVTAIPAGLATGILGGLGMVDMIANLARLAEAVDRIFGRLGVGVPRPPKPGGQQASGEVKGEAEGTDLVSLLTTLTGLFRAAGSGPTEKGAQGVQGDGRLLDTLRTAEALLKGITPVVDGLVRLVPTIVGALASIVVRLDDIKLAFLDLILFMARNLLLIRGVVLSVLFDTIHAAAELASRVLAILGVTISKLVDSLIAVLQSFVDVALKVLGFLAEVLQRTINELMTWLSGPFFKLLDAVGRSFVFETIVKLVLIIPRALPALYEIKTGKSFALEFPGVAKDLAKINIDPAAMSGRAPEGGAAPDLVKAVSASAKEKNLDDEIAKARDKLQKESKGVVDALVSGANDIDRAAKDAQTTGEERLRDQLAAAGKRVEEFNKATTTPAVKTAEGAKVTEPAGLVAIARAYEDWVSKGGLAAVLKGVTDYFTAPGGEAVPAAVAQRGANERAGGEPAPTHPKVEIDSVVIELAPPPPPAPAKRTEAVPPAPATSVTELTEAVLMEMARRDHERTHRGAQDATSPGSSLLQIMI